MGVRRIKGSWWVDVYHRSSNGQRQRYRLRSPDDSRDGAVAYERKVIAKLVNGEPVCATRESQPSQQLQRFAGFSAEWWKTYVQNNLELSTQREYEGVLRRVLVPFFGQERLDTITPHSIERFKAWRKESRATSKTINNELGILSKLLRTAAEWSMLRGAPKIRFLPEEPPETDFLTMAESQKLLEHTVNPMWRMFIFVALRTGLRAGELIGLRWEDIDLSARLIVVRRSIVRGVVKYPKTRRIRYVAMAWDLHGVLSAVHQPTGYLFTRPGDEPVTHTLAYGAVRRACKKAGMRRVGLHVLRHSFASHLMMEGQDLYSVQRLLGHTNPLMTQRYAHLAPAYLRSVVDSLPRAHGSLAQLVGTCKATLEAQNGEQKANTASNASGSASEISASHSEKRPVLPVSFHGRADRN